MKTSVSRFIYTKIKNR
uniref:Uncharacterized protein n=1 Tax=Anguilla anguilla TaxID=7936 RepID=A0A0E9W331_ANGAN